jgi:uncharacterized protein YybS (DUF2232 family)
MSDLEKASFVPKKDGSDHQQESSQVDSGQEPPSRKNNVEKKTPLGGENAPALRMVETAFFASTASLIWLVNYYFPLGPLLRIFFPIPMALIYLRWGHRAAWMSALVSGLLLSVLMGPTRSILFVIPFAVLGVLLGGLWRRKVKWSISIFLGSFVGVFGFFFRFWLLSILLGENLWVYVTSQVTDLLEWFFVKMGLLMVPSLFWVQFSAILLLWVNSVMYLFVVHLVALLLLDRLGNPIPRPPNWIKILIDYEE